MQNIRIQLKDIRHNAALGCFEATAVLSGAVSTSVGCAYPATPDCDLNDVIRGLTRAALATLRGPRRMSAGAVSQGPAAPSDRTPYLN